MSKELVVSSNRHETKLAILEDDRLVEIYVERRSNHAIAGSVYKGRVSRVLPGMQSAFVKLGLARDAFLYVSDVLDQTAELENGDDPDPAETSDEQLSGNKRRAGSGRRRNTRPNSRSRDSKQLETQSADDSQGGSETEKASADGGDSEESGRSAGRRSGRRRGHRGREGDRGRIHGGEVERTEASTSENRGSPTETEDPVFEVLPGESLSKYRAADKGPAANDDACGFAAGGEEIEAAEERDEDARDGGESDKSEDAEEAISALGENVEVDALEDPDGLDDNIEYDDEVEDAIAQPPAVASDNGAAQDDSTDGVDTDGEHNVDAAVMSPAESSRFQRRARRGRRRGSRDAEPPEAANEDQGAEENSEDSPVEAKTSSSDSDVLPNIKDLLEPGQELIVQIAKEPLGKKGARITSHVALPGRFMVYMPTVNHNGVSKKIRSDSERVRLRRVVKAHAEDKPGGFIVRTAGRGASEEELQADLEFLYKQWQGILEKAEKRRAPALLYHDLDVVERVMRDQLGQSYKTIWVDGQEEYERVLRFVERFQPDLLDRVKFYTRSVPIYDEFNISQELEKALRPKVWLKSGGYLVITQTEALVAIDVNTGKYVGKSDRLEDTIVKTNMEAAEEVVRQMRLRDLGGIVIVDFIDMEDHKNRRDVYQIIEAALRRDRAPAKVLPFNDFGLVAITRKRVKQSLERVLCAPCPTCAGSGIVKSAPTVISEILDESRKMALDAEETKDVVLRVYPEVAKILKSRSNSYLRELEETFKANVLIRGDAELSPEQFDFH